MKKLIAIAMAAVLCLGLVACGGTSSSTASTGGSEAVASGTEGKSYKIGVVQAKIDDESALISEYYQDYVGPHYNCEFVFSEACSTTDATMTAIENFADAGCDGIMSFASTDALQQARLCQELGMAFSFNGNRTPMTEDTFTAGLDNFAGSFGADQPQIGHLFSDWMSTLDLSSAKGFVVLPSIAYKGNPQHIEITKSILESIQNGLGLTFTQSIDELATTASPISAENDKNVEVYIYPGTNADDGWLQGFSAALQTGKYDYVLSAQAIYSVGAVVIQEVEASYDQNIVVGSFGTIGESLATAFNTNDKFGNPSVDMATMKPSTVVASLAFAQMYNQLSGHHDQMQDANGEQMQYMFQMWSATTPADYDAVAGWDKGADTYIVNYDMIDSMLFDRSPKLTSEGLQEVLDGITYDSVAARLG